MKSYLKFLSRNKLYTAIEAVGLAVSLAFVIIIGSYVWQQYAVTRENPNWERIYVPGLPGFPALTYGFPDVITDIPEIEAVSRLCNVVVHPVIRGEETEARSAGVEPEFFDICPEFCFVEGSAAALSAPSSVILSASFANTHSLSVGDALEISEKSYVVGAILEDLKGTVIQPYEIFRNADVFKNNWQRFDNFGSTVVLIKARPGTDRQVLYDKLEAVCKEVYADMYGRSFFEQLDLSRYDELFFKDTSGIFRHGDKNSLKVLMLVGLLLLVSAILNYINLSVALTGKRAKEMAVRQLSGAARADVVAKYIGESVAFTAVCFAAGLLLAQAFCPMINRLLNNPDIPVKVACTPGYISAYIAIILIVGILCGVFPAMMAGRYKPIEVIKGGYRRRSKMVFSKVFIVLQNALAVFLIAMALIMEAQYNTSLHRPLHANTKNLVLVRALATGNMEVLEASLSQLPFVQEMGRASNAPLSHNSGQYSQTRDGQDILYWYFKVDTTAFRMLGFEVLKDYHTPVIGGVWFCETAFNATGLTDDDLSCEVLANRTGNDCDHVAGIIADFVTEPSNMGAVEPAIVTIVPEERLEGSYLLKLSGDGPKIRAQLQETLDNWKTTTHVYWLGITYVEDRLREGLRPAQNNMRLLEIFMVLAVIISLLGLVAMSTYYAGERSASIAVRKVFGGTVESELWRSVRDYMIMVGVACAIGIPIAVWAARKYLEGFTVKLENYGWIFVVAVVLSVSFAFVSVLWQTLKAAKTNPAIELKKE